MGRTIAEKIIGKHVGRDVSFGETVAVEIDLCVLHDGVGLQIARHLQKLGVEKLANPRRNVLVFDRTVPASGRDQANDLAHLRDFAMKTGIIVSEVGAGICHNVINEQYTGPGNILIGADRYTSAGGALGAFAIGKDSNEVANTMARGKTWLNVPETVKIFLTGEFPVGVFAKDLILHLIGLLGADNAADKAVEFCGPAIDEMSMDSRFTLASMAVELGAISGLIASDELTKKYLAKMGRDSAWRPISADPDAVYAQVLEFNLNDIEPTVSFPHSVENTRTISEAAGVTINQIFFGSCSNSHLEDWEVVARIVRGKKKAPGILLIAAPGSRLIEKLVLDAGYYQVLSEFGAVFLPPGCGACGGFNGGIPADGERVLGTVNSNIKGRMGNPEAEIYLASPATIAASAIEGVIADPRKYADELTSKTFSTVVRTEAIKKVALVTMDSIEKVAAETAKKWGPRIKETSDVIEQKARQAASETARKLGPRLKETSETVGQKTRQIIEKYEPQAKKAAVDLEITIKTLAKDATKAIKDILATGKDGVKARKTDNSDKSKPVVKTSIKRKSIKKKAIKKKTKNYAPKTTAKKTVRKTARKKAPSTSAQKKKS